MAKKRKKKRSFGSQLKYEVYGILIITISMIALSGEATVGQALSKLFGVFLGKFYFALAIAGIIVGLAVMVKRAWPSGWSTRKTGVVILLLSLTLSSSISHINARYMGLDNSSITGSIIMKTLDQEIRSQLFDTEMTQGTSIRDLSISGGYVGAIQYSLLFMLFGYYGALIINIVMYLISILLITGKSYVEMLRFIRVKLTRLIKLVVAKIGVVRARQKALAKVSKDVHYIDDDEEEEEVQVEITKPKRKSYFFQWNQEQTEVHDDEWELNHQEKLAANDHVLEQYEEIVEEQEEIVTQEPNLVLVDRAASESVDQQIDQETEYDADWQVTDHSQLQAPVEGLAQAVHSSTVVGEQDELAEQDDEDHHINSVNNSNTIDRSDDYDYPEGQAVTSDVFITEHNNGDEAGKIEANVQPKAIPYQMPPFTILNKPVNTQKGSDGVEMYDSRRKLEATLESFGVRAKVLDVVRGPAVTRYEVQPATGVKVSRIVGLTDDIALALAAKDVRMEAPIPGKSAIGIEVPNGEISVVTMREVMETPVFMNAASKLSIAFGRDISGQSIVGNLAKMPHLLVAGATGSGKSVCINGIIASILYKANPDEVKFLMIDPKMVELNMYNGIPHLLAPVVTNPKRASLALKKIVVEMEKRYELFSKSGTRNIEGYNQHVKDDASLFLPYIVVIVDELADLMMVASNDVEDAIARLAQMARAAGIHLIIATQRPSVDVITGVIKANIPSRIAFGVSSQVDSRTILDVAGAEKLLGRGDMLFLPMGMNKPIRVQGAFLSDEEVEALVSYVSSQGEVKYNDEIVPELDDELDDYDEVYDDLFDDAAKIVIESGQASVSLLQRRMRIGYTRAARIIDQLEAKSIVGPYEGSKPRSVLVSLEQWNAK
ncbi:FtsK/SpoIIIE family DNA translocase [Paenibacillus endoradicis]|uniref:FtsK/SpoIIIE family DNA translocase n=1 Tax=Paenibacillus endoradicis TaxID=2972487 RepID=UPI00215911B8|nr:DNA translocase FtsK [Paenibacillus endoradicis]MCR8656319.1 DNA translocase FtsK [Paenibacillus endoradicis]